MFYSIILFSAVIITAWLGIGLLNKKDIPLGYWLLFAATFLFTVTVIHLIPELYEHGEASIMSMLLIIGFLFQLFLDYFSGGIEHGHMHTGNVTRPFVLFISLGIHSFLEGSLLSDAYGMHSHHGHENILLGILLHKIPATFALLSLLFNQTSKWKAWVFIFLFALTAPFGLLSSKYWISLINPIFFYALVCGMLLHLALVIFFENHKGHRAEPKRIIIILLSAFLAFLINFL